MSKGTVICLCDLTGKMAEPWVEAGYRAVWWIRSIQRLALMGDMKIFRQPFWKRCHGFLKLFVLRTLSWLLVFRHAQTWLFPVPGGSRLNEPKTRIFRPKLRWSLSNAE